MKNLNKVLASAIALVAFATTSNAQTAASATADASARIVTAIAIAPKANLNFGNIIRGANGGTVTVAATSAGARTAGGSGGTITLAGAAGTFYAAKFTVTGDGGATYAITRTPATGTSLILTGPSSTMNADLIVSASGTGSATTTGTLSGANGSAGGTEDIYVGGTLTVGPTQASGLYTISQGITISVDYN